MRIHKEKTSGKYEKEISPDSEEKRGSLRENTKFLYENKFFQESDF